MVDTCTIALILFLKCDVTKFRIHLSLVTQCHTFSTPSAPLTRDVIYGCPLMCVCIGIRNRRAARFNHWSFIASHLPVFQDFFGLPVPPFSDGFHFNVFFWKFITALWTIISRVLRPSVMFLKKKSFCSVRMLASRQTPGWRTTPDRLLSTAYSIC